MAPGVTGSIPGGGAPTTHPSGELARAALVVTAAAIVGLGTADLVQHYRLAAVSSLGGRTQLQRNSSTGQVGMETSWAAAAEPTTSTG